MPDFCGREIRASSQKLRASVAPTGAPPDVKAHAMFLFRSFALLAALLVSAQCSHAVPTEFGVSVDDFAEIVEISRLPVAQQAPKIAQLYEWFPALNAARARPYRTTEGARYPELTLEEKQLSGKEQIMLAYKRGSWERYVEQDSNEIATQILSAHPAQVAALLHDDLRSNDEKRQARGFSNQWALPLEFWGENRASGMALSPQNARLFDRLYDDVAHVFQSAPPTAPVDNSSAAHNYWNPAPLKVRTEDMLTTLGDARAIALLIGDDAAQPALHYWAIAGLARRAPNDAALQPLKKLLVSDDAELRYRAVFALPASTAATRTALPVLLEDTDAKTRALAVSKAFELKGSQFEKVKAQLKVRLADTDLVVRRNAAIGFAKRGDAIAAPVLLELWRNDDNWTSLMASSALAQLTGEKFDTPITTSPNGVRTVNMRDAASIARVEAWIVAHPAQ